MSKCDPLPLPAVFMNRVAYDPMPEDLRNALFRYAAARLRIYETRPAKGSRVGFLEYSLAAYQVEYLQKKYGIRYI